MFNKKKCGRCNKKADKKNSFCPHCGNYLSPYKAPDEKKDDWGMLGKNDSHPFNEMENLSNSPFGGFGGKIFEGMINRTMKILEKEMQRENQNFHNTPRQNIPQNQKAFTHFELFINGKRISPENIKITQRPVKAPPKKQKSNPNRFLSTENAKKFLELKKSEPETNLRRLENKIIYEINIPGVKDIEDVSIVKMEKSIEVRAVANDRAYVKIIPIDMEISAYEFSKGKLILELIE